MSLDLFLRLEMGLNIDGVSLSRQTFFKNILTWATFKEAGKMP